MDSLPSSAAPVKPAPAEYVYLLSDILPGHAARSVHSAYHGQVGEPHVEVRQDWHDRGLWAATLSWTSYTRRDYDHEPTLAEVRDLARPHAEAPESTARRYCGNYTGRVGTCEGETFLDSALLARKVRDRWPLTSAQLLLEPDFARQARRVAEAGQTFSSDLLEWEKKAVVQEAVAQVRAMVDAERADRTARAAALAQTALEKRRRELPTVEAVTDAYERCHYRTCKQGHVTVVRIAEPGQVASVRSDTSRGERYSSRCTWRKTESTHILTVPADWLESVEARGLERWQGCLVLSATPVGHTADNAHVVLRLLLVRQGRGTELTTQRVDVVYLDTRTAEPVEKDTSVRIYSDERVAHDALIDAGLVAG